MAQKRIHVSVLFNKPLLIRDPLNGSAREFEIQAARLNLLVLVDSTTGKVVGTMRRDGLCDHNGNHFDD